MAKKVLFVFGTRPEVIKMAPVIELAKKRKGAIAPVICVTAQHRFLMDQALAEFDIKPDIDLNLMKPNQTLCDVTSRVLRAMRQVYKDIRPDTALVQGDTSTVFAAALAAYYEHIDIGHIEAGLRSGDDRNPFPEEINRRFVSLVAKYNFCPTELSKKNLLSEGVTPAKIFVTGNTVIDALKAALKRVRAEAPVIKGVGKPFLERPYALITGHRRENFDGGIRNISVTVKSLAARHKDFHWIWSVHLNPNARNVVYQTLDGLPNVRLIEPAGYGEFVYLMDRSKFILSDSGGVQEEAPSLGKKVLVTRVCTERPEAVAAGCSVIVGTDPGNIQKHVNMALKAGKNDMVEAVNPFGDGMAAYRIIDVLLKGRCGEFNPPSSHQEMGLRRVFAEAKRKIPRVQARGASK